MRSSRRLARGNLHFYAHASHKSELNITKSLLGWAVGFERPHQLQGWAVLVSFCVSRGFLVGLVFTAPFPAQQPQGREQGLSVLSTKSGTEIPSQDKTSLLCSEGHDPSVSPAWKEAGTRLLRISDCKVSGNFMNHRAAAPSPGASEAGLDGAWSNPVEQKENINSFSPLSTLPCPPLPDVPNLRSLTL